MTVAYVHPAPSTRIVADLHGDGQADLATCYEICRRVNAAHGRTYYLATQLLPAAKRRHVHALYAFARYADDLVDHLALDWDPQRRATALEAFSASVDAALVDGVAEHPVVRALVATVAALEIDPDDLRAFLRSMVMDTTVTRYATYDDLNTYMYGSAAVIGTMMLPILEPVGPAARDRAQDLGVAFQLTNFIRDVGEDADRGRIYLPLEDLERFGVCQEDFRRRRVTPAVRRLLAFQIGRARRLYRRAWPGIDLLAPSSRPTVRVAFRLYAAILDRVEAADYQVFTVRATVPAARRVAVVLSALAHAR